MTDLVPGPSAFVTVDVQARVVRTRIVLDTSVLVADPGVHRRLRRRRRGHPADGHRGARRAEEPRPTTSVVRRAPRCARIEELRVRAGGSLAEPVPVGDRRRRSTRADRDQRRAEAPADRARPRPVDARQPDHRRRARPGRCTGRRAMVSNDAALRIKAAHLGVAGRRAPPGRAQPGARGRCGWTHVRGRPTRPIDALYAAGAIAVDSVAGAQRSCTRTGSPSCAAGSQSALARRVDDDLVLLSHDAPEAWGLRPRSKEQRFALELLLDPDVSVVALDGRAGTGKTLMAIAAGLEQVVERRALRAARRLPPARAGRSGRCRLPARRARREARPVDVGHPRRDRRPHRSAQQPRRPPADRRADRPQPAVARSRSRSCAADRCIARSSSSTRPRTSSRPR